jgi:hypothetical protein
LLEGQIFASSAQPDPTRLSLQRGQPDSTRPATRAARPDPTRQKRGGSLSLGLTCHAGQHKFTPPEESSEAAIHEGRVRCHRCMRVCVHLCFRCRWIPRRPCSGASRMTVRRGPWQHNSRVRCARRAYLVGARAPTEHIPVVTDLASFHACRHTRLRRTCAPCSMSGVPRSGRRTPRASRRACGRNDTLNNPGCLC